MGKTLYYFTDSFPYGLGEQWKANELNELVHYFDDIVVVPYSYSGNKTSPKSVPKGVKVQDPLFEDANLQISRLQLLKILFHPKVYIFLSEFFKKKVFLKKKWLISWITATLNAIRLLKHPFFKTLQKTDTHNTILYFYWGKGSCEVLPFINTGLFNKLFVRMHGYDLFEYRNNNYIPYRKQLLKKISIAAPVSAAGSEHLIKLYPDLREKVQVFRCGTVGNNKFAQPSEDKILRVVSCSYLLPVKRVHIMIEALALLDIPVLWRHIGDGVLHNELEQLIIEKKLSEKFVFIGEIQSDKVLDYYTANNFDIFVNVSSSEGVPISIMEAFSVGIPVMATNVGGTGEIVNDTVGELLPSDVKPEILADALTRFYNLSFEEKNELRKNAYITYLHKCNAQKLGKELAEYLIS